MVDTHIRFLFGDKALCIRFSSANVSYRLNKSMDFVLYVMDNIISCQYLTILNCKINRGESYSGNSKSPENTFEKKNPPLRVR